jgi:hypothetical protein
VRKCGREGNAECGVRNAEWEECGPGEEAGRRAGQRASRRARPQVSGDAGRSAVAVSVMEGRAGAERDGESRRVSPFQGFGIRWAGTRGYAPGCRISPCWGWGNAGVRVRREWW